MWHTSTGTIQYDPPRPNMKKKTRWWAVVNVDREITRYYRWWVKQNYWIDLCQPSWDAHISIIRGERPPKDKQRLWKKYDGQKITFEYSHIVTKGKDPSQRKSQVGDFWLVNVRCPLLKQIREEFGFPTNWNHHITIGRTWY